MRGYLQECIFLVYLIIFYSWASANAQKQYSPDQLACIQHSRQVPLLLKVDSDGSPLAAKFNENFRQVAGYLFHVTAAPSSGNITVWITTMRSPQNPRQAIISSVLTANKGDNLMAHRGDLCVMVSSDTDPCVDKIIGFYMPLILRIYDSEHPH
jgi:hypothetical protein